MAHSCDFTCKIAQFSVLLAIFGLVLRCTVVNRRRLVEPGELIIGHSTLVKGRGRRLLPFEGAALHGLHGSSAALLLLKRIYLVVRLYQKRFIAAVGLQVGWAATGRVKLHVHGVLIEFQVARVADDGTWQGDKLLARLIIILGVFLIDDRC